MPKKTEKEKRDEDLQIALELAEENALTNQKVIKEEQEHVFRIAYQLSETEAFKKIRAAYAKKFNRPIPEDETKQKNDVLLFSSEKEAQEFFAEQAQDGTRFLATWLDENNNATDNHHFSCGDGALYSGSYSEICLQLEAVIKDDKSNLKAVSGLATIKSFMPPHPVQVASEKMQALRSEARREQEAVHSIAPNPSSMSPGGKKP